MEELAKAIAAKAGIPQDQAVKAAQAALDFLKDKLPGGLGAQLEGFLAGNADGIGDAVGDVADKLKGMFGGS